MTKKSVRFDEEVGGAISTPTAVEAGPAKTAFASLPRDDFRIIEDDVYSSENPNQYEYFYDALNMNPRNMFPMFQYLPSSEGQNPSYTKDVLLRGLSGYGSHKDPMHIQAAVVHSLKKYPHLLRMYMNSANLII